MAKKYDGWAILTPNGMMYFVNPSPHEQDAWARLWVFWHSRLEFNHFVSRYKEDHYRAVKVKIEEVGDG